MSIDDTARRITIGLDPHGRPIARKQGDPARIAHEVEVLLQVQVPGVVRLVTHDQMTGELGLSWTGGRSLADPPARRPAAEVTSIVRALARTVSTVHAAGVVHQRIEPSHVLVTDDGPILTGFAEASIVDHEERVDPHVDVAAIGRLIDVLLGPASVPARPESRATIRRRTSARSHRSEPSTADLSTKRAGSDHATATLRRLARRAQDRSSLCTIEELCSTLDTIVTPPPAPITSTLLDSGFGDRTQRFVSALRDRPRVVGLVAGAVAIVGALIVGPRLTPPGDRVATADAPDTTITAPTTSESAISNSAIAGAAAPSTSASTPPTTTTFAGELVWPPPTALAPDPERFTVRGQSLETGIVEASGVRYRLAADPQDRWLTGNWNCDDNARLALLRLPSGAVDVFDAWPQAGRPVTSRRVALIAGAVDLAATDDACPRLAVTDIDGNTITVAAS